MRDSQDRQVIGREFHTDLEEFTAGRRPDQDPEFQDPLQVEPVDVVFDCMLDLLPGIPALEGTVSESHIATIVGTIED